MEQINVGRRKREDEEDEKGFFVARYKEKVRKRAEERRKVADEIRKLADEREKRENVIFDCLQYTDVKESVVESVVESDMSLLDLGRYSPEKLASKFKMALKDAIAFAKNLAARNENHEEAHVGSEKALAHKCFQVPFKGSAHEELYRQLVELRGDITKTSYYSPYCALVQSSGVGKSRALMELSKLDVYICYCSLASTSATAFPPRTVGLADKLASTFTEHGMVLYLKAWLRVLAAWIRTGTMSSEEWKRRQLPGEDGSLAKEVLDDWKLLEEDGSDAYLDQDHDNVNAKACEEVISSVKGALPADRPCSVIFAFDEARGLQKEDPDSKSMNLSPFYQLRRALRVFFEHQTFCAIMLDTSAKVGNLLPANKHNEDSNRAISMGFPLAHPIYFLPNMSLFKTGPSIVSDHYEPKQCLKQGRPMWSARLEVEGNASNVRNFALQKLVRIVAGPFGGEGGPEVDVHRGRMTESQAMALLSATAGLSICARSELAQVMSASHMSVILRVSEDRSRVYIGLPAEPILAEGAAFALRDKVVQEGALKHLLAACKVGYVTPGPRGEFAAKFILVAAMWDKKEEWQLRRIAVETYLEKVLVNGKDDMPAFDKVKAACPKGGTVFFNSFVLVRKPPTIATLERAFGSGYALMYRAENDLPGVDMIIPVQVSGGMTCIAVSAKNLQRAGWLEEESTAKVEVTAGLILITLLMSLREPGTKKERGSWVLWKSPEGDVATAEDPNMHLTCYGIDSNYPFLTQEVKELLKEVLFTVPDELAGATDKEKEWIQGLLPEQYY